MRYWMLVVSRENFEVCRKMGFVMAGMKKRWERQAALMEVGDKIVYYVKGEGRFAGIVSVESRYWVAQGGDDSWVGKVKGVWNDVVRRLNYPFRVKTGQVLMLRPGEELAVGKVKDKLRFLRKWRAGNWGLGFQGNVHALEGDDFEMIRQEMVEIYNTKRAAMKTIKQLTISNLRVGVGGKEILKGVSVVVRSGEIHAVMGPNGSGKSTLAMTIAGHPDYQVIEGKVEWGSIDLLGLSVDERAKQGVFLVFQSPVAIPGVGVLPFLWRIRGVARGEREESYVGRSATTEQVGQVKQRLEMMKEFRAELGGYMEKLGLDETILKRGVNEGFSGGERKKLEVLQMMVLKPRVVILDEIDSGVDVDAMRIIAKAIGDYMKQFPETVILAITHYSRFLKYLKVKRVHIVRGGEIVMSGSSRLAMKIEREGYGGGG